MSIKTYTHFRVFGVVAQDSQDSFKFAIQAVRLQFNHNFTLTSGRDVRIPPYQIGASGKFNLGDIEGGFPEIFDDNAAYDRLGGYQLPDI